MECVKYFKQCSCIYCYKFGGNLSILVSGTSSYWIRLCIGCTVSVYPSPSTHPLQKMSLTLWDTKTSFSLHYTKHLINGDRPKRLFCACRSWNTECYDWPFTCHYRKPLSEWIPQQQSYFIELMSPWLIFYCHKRQGPLAMRRRQRSHCCVYSVRLGSASHAKRRRLHVCFLLVN